MSTTLMAEKDAYHRGKIGEICRSNRLIHQGVTAILNQATGEGTLGIVQMLFIEGRKLKLAAGGLERTGYKPLITAMVLGPGTRVIDEGYITRIIGREDPSKPIMEWVFYPIK